MPRTNSMKAVQSILITGMCDRRPSASRMPSGNDTAMPTKERMSVTIRPPQSGVSTKVSPNQPPGSRIKEMSGRTAKSRMALMPL
ncbi:hypothetical protein D9M72_587660 [compost metagenome]